MATKIVTKNSSTASAAPTASDLVQGELAVNVTDKRLYTENASGAIVELGTSPSTIDINAGTIDGATVGATSASTGAFTTLSASGEITANGGIALGDNDKATFGASDDLSIYHQSSNGTSYIEEVGSGNLVVRTNGSLIEFDKGSTEYMVRMIVDGAVELYYDNALKLATTATGIDVTGTATMDGLTVDSAINTTAIMINTPYGTAGEQYSSLLWNNSSFVGGDSEIRNVVNGAGSVGSSLEFHTDQHGTGTLTERLKLHNNGDISFYEDTGTTPKMVWKASDERLGIGTSSPDTLLEVVGADPILTVRDTSTSGAEGKATLRLGESDASDTLGVHYDIALDNLALTIGYAASNVATTERMRIDSSGNVRVGHSDTTTASSVGGRMFANGVINAITGEDACFNARRLTSNGTVMSFISSGGSTVGTIVTAVSSTAYNTSSDYRLKEDDVPMTGATERVKALRPINFAWKVDGSRVDGFLAHEAQAVVPECVTGTKDAMKDEEYEVTAAVYEDVITPAVEAVAGIEAIEAVEAVDAVYDDEGVLVSEAIEAVEAVGGVEAVEAQEATTESVLTTEAVMGTRSVPDYQGIDQSKLVPLLTAALQEAIARIETLEGQ